MKILTALLFTVVATLVMGQDYTMYETHTLTPKDGHEVALDESIAEHNKLYHADGPYQNFMFSILNGPKTGDILFAMGSCTFSQLDDRPSSRAHNKDWDSVLAHSDGGAKNIEYWVLNDDLSSPPPTATDTPKPMSRVRYFEVSDNSDFKEMQVRINKTIEAMGVNTPRFFYKNRFQNKEGRDWALVTWYDNWAGLDAGNWDVFEMTFIKLYGEDGWKKLDDEYDEVVISREDEMRARRPDLQAEKKK